MSRNKLQARYGLKYNPFLPAVPGDDYGADEEEEVASRLRDLGYLG